MIRVMNVSVKSHEQRPNAGLRDYDQNDKFLEL